MNIRNCIIKYKCPNSWDSLTKTVNPSIRYCDTCDKGVHYCKDEHELKIAMNNDWCVAMHVESDNNACEESYKLMGDVHLV